MLTSSTYTYARHACGCLVTVACLSAGSVGATLIDSFDDVAPQSADLIDLGGPRLGTPTSSVATAAALGGRRHLAVSLPTAPPAFSSAQLNTSPATGWLSFSTGASSTGSASVTWGFDTALGRVLDGDRFVLDLLFFDAAFELTLAMTDGVVVSAVHRSFRPGVDRVGPFEFFFADFTFADALNRDSIGAITLALSGLEAGADVRLDRLASVPEPATLVLCFTAAAAGMPRARSGDQT